MKKVEHGDILEHRYYSIVHVDKVNEDESADITVLDGKNKNRKSWAWITSLYLPRIKSVWST